MQKLSDETRQRLSACSSATLSTQLFKRGLRNQVLQGVSRLTPKAPTLVGEAYTLRNIPAREDIDHIGVYDNPEHPQRKAIETAPPGSVLVIDCREDARFASAGGILLRRLEVRGVAGMVTDGGLRDTPEIAARSFPVYCKAPAAPISLIGHHAVESNVPIACGGVAVYPGDVIVGDGEGVIVIPRGIADEVAADTFEQEKLEEFVQQEIASGHPLPGTYPPNAETKARYEVWRKERH
ncbi:MAG: ribonuclease activity regulator RraA [Betaproteobacteria bacterium]